MSTRSFITFQDGNEFHSIYCHFDGYIDGVGKILHNHYQDKNKIKKLIQLGSLSCLGEEIGEKHPFDNHQDEAYEKWCCAYGRDRGETNVKPIIYNSIEEIINGASDCGAEFVYLWRDGEWFVCDDYRKDVFVKLDNHI